MSIGKARPLSIIPCTQLAPQSQVPTHSIFRAPGVQFAATGEGERAMQQISDTFVQGVQGVTDAASRRPTAADLTAAKQLEAGLGSRYNKRGRDIATLGFGHAQRKARRGRQAGNHRQTAQGAGMMALSATGLAAATLSVVGLEIITLVGMGRTGDAHKRRSAAGTLKHMVSVELYRVEDQLRSYTRHIEDSFLTGEVAPALCLEVISDLRKRLPTLRKQLEENPEPRVARSRRLPRQIDAIDRLLLDVAAQAERHARIPQH